MKTLHHIAAIAVVALLCAPTVFGEEKADLVRVVKREKRLYLIRDGEVFASFHVVFGGNPMGHKERQGDERTPEGQYLLDYKNAGSAYYKSIHVSYPNAKDREHARKLGVSPGGDIMIHGQPNGKEIFTPVTQLFNWTDGCIALSNKNMEIVWKAVDVGTPIEIEP
jgi:murein L,D-transpeptidase YafK